MPNISIDQAYKLLESVSDGKPFDVSISYNNFYNKEPKKNYKIYIEHRINIDGRSFEECFNQFAVMELKSDGHYYKKVIRDHKRNRALHKILFRKF